MTEITTFNFESSEVRTVLMDGEPWFVAKDVCAVLEIGNSRMAVTRLDEDGVSTTDIIDSMGRTQQASVVNEAGVYELVFLSRKPEAKAFKRWLTHEVLPAIRKTGSYTAMPQTYSEALRELAANVEAKELAEARAKELEVPAKAWGVMVAAQGDYAVDEAAKILSRDDEIEIGRNRLFQFMADLGWTYRQGSRNSWHAYQAQVDNGRIVLRMSAAFLNAKTGEMENPAPTIRVTAKGIDALRAALLKASA